MSRGLLNKNELKQIERNLPDLTLLQRKALLLSPEFISMKYPPTSRIPIASVCLQDAIHTLSEVKFALHEVYAHQYYYRIKKQPSNELASVWAERYYTDDAALRLYACGEHLANALSNILEIDEIDLKPYKDRYISKQIIVGKYLLEQKPSLTITGYIRNLAQSKEWKATIDYRNEWVHQQPPTVQDLGIVHHRRTKWQVYDNRCVLTVGGGDQPKHRIENVTGFVKAAFLELLKAVDGVIDNYIVIIKDKGIEITDTSINVTL